MHLKKVGGEKDKKKKDESTNSKEKDSITT